MEKGTERIIRIAVVGPESTGKSVLCEQLAMHYNTVFVPEFARNYLNQLGRPYTYDDVLTVARKQMQQEKEMEPFANRLIFCDTTLLSIKIWFEVVFKKIPEEIESGLKRINYDFYILTDIDMPWVPDPLREHPHFRKELLEMHRSALQNMNATYSLISGLGVSRLNNAISIVNGIINAR